MFRCPKRHHDTVAYHTELRVRVVFQKRYVFGEVFLSKKEFNTFQSKFHRVGKPPTRQGRAVK